MERMMNILGNSIVVLFLKGTPENPKDGY
jgi:glutaredoxin-related protein